MRWLEQSEVKFKIKSVCNTDSVCKCVVGFCSVYTSIIVLSVRAECSQDFAKGECVSAFPGKSVSELKDFSLSVAMPFLAAGLCAWNFSKVCTVIAL